MPPNSPKYTFELPAIEPDEIALISREVLRQLEKQIGPQGSLKPEERVVLGQILLDSVDSSASTWKELKTLVPTQNRGVSKLMQTIRRKLASDPKNRLNILPTAAVENKNADAYYMRATPGSETPEPQRDTPAETVETPSPEEVIAKIRAHLSTLTQSLTQEIKLENGEFDIPTGLKEEIARKIEEISEEVMRLTLPKEECEDVEAKWMADQNKLILSLILKHTLRGKAVTTPHLFEEFKKEYPETTAEEFKVRLDAFRGSLQRSPNIKIAIKAVLLPRKGKTFGHYLTMKPAAEEKREEEATAVELSEPIADIPAERRQPEILTKLLDNALRTMYVQADLVRIILLSLKDACAQGKSITPEYCLAKARELDPSTTQTTRNYSEGIRRVSATWEEDYGIVLHNEGNRYETVLPEKPAKYQPILAKLQKEEETSGAEGYSQNLEERVLDGLRHIQSKNPKATRKIMKVLIVAAKKNEPLTFKQAIERSGTGVNKDFMRHIKTTIERINSVHPTLLGFEFVETSSKSQVYILKLKEPYQKADVDFKNEKVSPLPLKVEGGIEFDQQTFDREIIRLTTGQSHLGSQKAEALKALAIFAAKDEAASAELVELKMPFKVEARRELFHQLIKTVEKLSRVLRVKRYKKSTYYITTIGTLPEGGPEPKRRPAPVRKPAPAPKPQPRPEPRSATTPVPALRPEPKPAQKPAPVLQPAPTPRPAPTPTQAPTPRPAPAPTTRPAPKSAPATRPQQTPPPPEIQPPFILDLVGKYLQPGKKTTIQDLQSMAVEIAVLLSNRYLEARIRARLEKMPNAIMIVMSLTRLRGSQDIQDSSKLSLKGILIGEKVQEAEPPEPVAKPPKKPSNGNSNRPQQRQTTDAYGEGEEPQDPGASVRIRGFDDNLRPLTVREIENL